MKFVCDRCQTKYAIADERVRGKILKVKCKTCANVMTVREGRRASTGPIPTVPAHEAESERTVLAPHPSLFAEPSRPVAPPPPPVAHPPARKTGSIPSVPPDDGVAWYMALSGERSGPFSRKQLVDKVAALPKNADLHVWNEQLGAWKPPTDVPALAADLTARRRAPPPPPAGAPRGMPHAPPPPPLGAAAHAAHPSVGHVPYGAPAHASPAGAAHASAPHIDRPARSASGPIVAPLGPGVGLKLPPPTGGGHARPTASATGTHPTHPPAHPPDLAVDIDPSTMLETPAPQPHMHPGLRRTNGVKSASAHPPAGATRSSSDVLNLLNLPGAPATASGGAGSDVAAPRLMSSAAAVGWSPDVEVPAARSRNARMVVILMAVLGCVVIALAFSAMKRRTPLPPPLEPTAQVSDPLAGVVAKMNEKPLETPPPPPPVVAPPPPPPPPPPQVGRGGKRGHTSKTSKLAAPPVLAPPTAVANADAARFQDKSGPAVKVVPAQAPSRPPPSQGQITSVINNNRNGIKTCYQRALARDNSLTRGKMTVGLTIGISGRVKQTKVDGPNAFRILLEPCIRELASRWVFPQASEEYGTEFPLVFQGQE